MFRKNVISFVVMHFISVTEFSGSLFLTRSFQITASVNVLYKSNKYESEFSKTNFKHDSNKKKKKTFLFFRKEQTFHFIFSEASILIFCRNAMCIHIYFWQRICRGILISPLQNQIIIIIIIQFINTLGL